MSYLIEKTKKQYGLPFIKVGMKVRDLFKGQDGKIIDGHRSGGLIIKTEDGAVGDYHPTWKMRYYNDDGSIAAEFN